MAGGIAVINHHGGMQREDGMLPDGGGAGAVVDLGVERLPHLADAVVVRDLRTTKTGRQTT